MRIKVLAFGIARDILGNRRLELEVPEETSVMDLKNHLIQRFPDFAKVSAFKLAVNQEYVQDSIRIRESDEVVIIPPVSGG